jgi:hypothetical protein
VAVATFSGFSATSAGTTSIAFQLVGGMVGQDERGMAHPIQGKHYHSRRMDRETRRQHAGKSPSLVVWISLVGSAAVGAAVQEWLSEEGFSIGYSRGGVRRESRVQSAHDSYRTYALKKECHHSRMPADSFMGGRL